MSLVPITRRAGLTAFAAALLFASCALAAKQQPPNNATDAKASGKKVALLVAVNDCNHDRFPALKFAENDIEELASFLQQSGYASVRVLSGTRGKKNPKDAPTAANIRAAFAQTLSGRARQDTVLVALAGHGTQLEVNDPDGDEPARSFGYFCPADADITVVKYTNGHAPRLILLDKMLNDLGRCAACNRFLLVDAGRLDEGNPAISGRSLNTERVTLPRGVAALFSCARGQTARESEKLGKGHGLFFHSVLEGLKGKAKNDAGEVTWDMLSAHVKRQVSQLASSLVGANVAQTPHGMNSLVGDPVLAKAQTIAKVDPTPKKDPLKPKVDPPASVPARKVALLVGVREYEEPRFTDLRFTENDIEGLAELLNGKAAGFHEVVVLTAARGKENAALRPTLKNIRAALAKLTGKLSKDDLVLVAFSGHGVKLTVAEGNKERDEPFLVPADGKIMAGKDYAELSKGLISVGELVTELQRGQAGTRLLLIDAGRSEVPASRQKLDGLTQVGGAKIALGTSVLFSCSTGERAFETPKLGKGHGLFFYHVLDGLRGQAKNDKGEVTWARLVEYVSDKVSEDAPAIIGGGAKQTPHEIGHLAGRSPLLAKAAK